MSEKVKLPKAVCDALDYAENRYPYIQIIENSFHEVWSNDDKCFPLNKMETFDLMKALVLGYEPELTAEEQIKELFFMRNDLKDQFDAGYCNGVRHALRIHGIHYDWLGDAE